MYNVKSNRFMVKTNKSYYFDRHYATVLNGDYPDPNHPGKILICHNGTTLSINPSGLNGHDGPTHVLDYDGPCEDDDSCESNVYDCFGQCDGPHILDCAGNCYNPESENPPVVDDCEGVCGGDSVTDCNGICNGNSFLDCNGVCGGSSIFDCAGNCYDPNFEDPSSLPDCLGVCGGDAVLDCNGVCNGSSILDCAGECYDPNSEDPPNYYDCKGNCISDGCTYKNKPKPIYSRHKKHRRRRKYVINIEVKSSNNRKFISKNN